jgi:D-Tyr-tRNAtyr deacylase
MTRRTLIQVQKAEPTQEEEIKGEEEAGLVVDVGTIPEVVVEEVREMHHRVEAQAAHTGAHNQMAAEEEDVETSS